MTKEGIDITTTSSASDKLEHHVRFRQQATNTVLFVWSCWHARRRSLSGWKERGIVLIISSRIASRKREPRPPRRRGGDSEPIT